MSDQRSEIFEYLNVLRDTGAINMFDAVPELVEEFGLTDAQAIVWLLEWMQSFGDDDEDTL